VVVANILAKALVALSDTLSDAVASGGILLLSGILEGQESEVVQAYPRMKFETVSREGWVLLSSR
jgi:ribosomal protein L11 methyltransferase